MEMEVEWVYGENNEVPPEFCEIPTEEDHNLLYESYMSSMPNPPEEYTGPTIPLSDTDSSLTDEDTRDLPDLVDYQMPTEEELNLLIKLYDGTGLDSMLLEEPSDFLIE